MFIEYHLKNLGLSNGRVREIIPSYDLKIINGNHHLLSPGTIFTYEDRELKTTNLFVASPIKFAKVLVLSNTVFRIANDRLMFKVTKIINRIADNVQ